MVSLVDRGLQSTATLATQNTLGDVDKGGPRRIVGAQVAKPVSIHGVTPYAVASLVHCQRAARALHEHVRGVAVRLVADGARPIGHWAGVGVRKLDLLRVSSFEEERVGRLVLRSVRGDHRRIPPLHRLPIIALLFIQNPHAAPDAPALIIWVAIWAALRRGPLLRDLRRHACTNADTHPEHCAFRTARHKPKIEGRKERAPTTVPGCLLSLPKHHHLCKPMLVSLSSSLCRSE